MWRRKRMLRELEEDIREHIAQETQDNIERGMTPKEAGYAARKKFGNVTRVKEDVREVWSFAWLEQWLRDIRFGVRMLAKTPVITVIALLSLGLGIGANTAIFSLIEAVMLRMLPVQNPEQLVQIKYISPTSPNPRASLTNPIWEEVRKQQDVFSGVLAWWAREFDLADGGEEHDVSGAYVSGEYFHVLGVRPAAGRLFLPTDDVNGCNGAAVLSYGFWQQRYGGAESAVGSSIRLNGHTFPIIGVAQRGFTGTEAGAPLDVTIPICAEALLDGKNAMLEVRDDWWLSLMGRLRPGMTVEHAKARMKALAPGIFGAVVPQDWPAKSQDIFRKYAFLIVPASTGVNGFSGVRDQYSKPLEVLMAVVGLVLLIACANLASLLMARSAARQKEFAVRLSLGASRGRVIRQVLAESLVLSSCGALAGILFARWGSAFLVRFVERQASPVFLDLRLNAPVLAFAIALALLCGLLFGVLPAFRVTRVSAMSAMKEGPLQSSGGRSHAAARWMVALQVALSLILLVGSGLFVHTFANLMTLDPGFDANNVLLVQANIHNAQVPEAARVVVYGQMLAKLEATPGVVSASQTWMTPLSGSEWLNDIKITGRQALPGVNPSTYMNWVTPAFFSTMRTRLLSGRIFDARDSATSTPVAVVDEFLARTFFPGADPVGQHLIVDTSARLSKQPMEIIGVVQNAKYDSLSEAPHPTVYFPLAQMSGVSEYSAFEIRTAGNPSAVVPAVRDSLGAVVKNASLRFVTLKQKADDSAVQERLLAVLSGFFGTLALALTAIGLYGVMAYAVALRTREIGIRMALGAKRGSVLSLVARSGGVVLVTGIAAGLLGSLWATRLTQQLLFGVKPTDPWSISLAVAALACVAAVASYVPARRAMRVDPTVALRYE